VQKAFFMGASTSVAVVQQVAHLTCNPEVAVCSSGHGKDS